MVNNMRTYIRPWYLKICTYKSFDDVFGCKGQELETLNSSLKASKLQKWNLGFILYSDEILVRFAIFLQWRMESFLAVD